MQKWIVWVGIVAVALGAQAGSHGESVQAASWSLDPAHSSVGFTVRHLGIVHVRGHFNEYEGAIYYDGENIESLRVEATIQAASVDTSVERRDDHLRSEDFFEVATYPAITFHSTGVVDHDDGYALEGALTIKEVTKPVRLPLVVNGPAGDPWGNQRIGIELAGSIDRHDFGVGFDGPADGMIGAVVRFDIQLQAIGQ